MNYRFQGRTPPAQGQRRSTLNLADAQTDGQVATIRLYDPIDSWGGDWGVSAKEFAQALDEIKNVGEIRVHINSPGGEVFEGIAIMNALRNHSAKVTTIVDGLAASAASFIAMAGDEVVMGQNAELMIHDAWGICIGNAADMSDMQGRLDHLSDNIASVYSGKAGTPVETWREAMRGETWYSAEEAVKAGLADRVEKTADAPKNQFDLSVFTYSGRAQAPAPKAIADDSPPRADEKPQTPEPEAAPASPDADPAAPAAEPAPEDAGQTTEAMLAITKNAARLAFS